MPMDLMELLKSGGKGLLNVGKGLTGYDQLQRTGDPNLDPQARQRAARQAIMQGAMGLVNGQTAGQALGATVMGNQAALDAATQKKQLGNFIGANPQLGTFAKYLLGQGDVGSAANIQMQQRGFEEAGRDRASRRDLQERKFEEQKNKNAVMRMVQEQILEALKTNPQMLQSMIGDAVGGAPGVPPTGPRPAAPAPRTVPGRPAHPSELEIP